MTLYVHIPFCRRKCPYCDFHSSPVEEIPEAPFLAAVAEELRRWRHHWAQDERPLQAIFLGGGTPSLLSGAAVARLLGSIQQHWRLAADCEITLEANPESASLEKMQQWHASGINRLSLGIQAFDEERLRFLQRPHDLATARRAIAAAQGVGFAALNLDLIYATPGQSLAAWGRELAEAMAWQPQHLSCYQLTVEAGTPFFAQRASWPPLEEALELAFFAETRSRLAEGGWLAYETSNFAQPGFTCRHNSNYWSFGDYVGIGPAAHGKWSDGSGGIWRTQNPVALADYLRLLEGEIGPDWPGVRVPPAEAGRECLVMGLRHAGGVERALYQRLTGVDLLAQHRSRWMAWQEAGFVRVEAERICLTEQGMPLADAMLLELF
ncbi:MAG: radical SAM family heme chaperone HemW [Magnetococcales bacterium]|nr:radical SAM family heme chaperone HemW [Magnetococcales bacterium]